MTDIALVTGLIVGSGGMSAFALVKAAFATSPPRGRDPEQLRGALRDAFPAEDTLPADMSSLLDRLN